MVPSIGDKNPLVAILNYLLVVYPTRLNNKIQKIEDTNLSSY